MAAFYNTDIHGNSNTVMTSTVTISGVTTGTFCTSRYGKIFYESTAINSNITFTSVPTKVSARDWYDFRILKAYPYTKKYYPNFSNNYTHKNNMSTKQCRSNARKTYIQSLT